MRLHSIRIYVQRESRTTGTEMRPQIFVRIVRTKVLVGFVVWNGQVLEWAHFKGRGVLGEGEKAIESGRSHAYLS